MSSLRDRVARWMHEMRPASGPYAARLRTGAEVRYLLGWPNA